MLNNIIKFSVLHKGAVIFLTLLTIIFGLYSFTKLPIDAVPDITNNQVQINTQANGMTAEEVEKMLTVPLESAVRGIPDTIEIRSLSRLGLSQITIIFKDDADIYRARQMVGERLQNAGEALPEGIVPKLGPISTGLGEIYQYVIEYKDIEVDPKARLGQLQELRTMQDWFVKPRMAGIEGVAEINTIGGYERQMHIVPDPKKLAAYGISFSDIGNAVRGATQNIGGGYIEQDAEQFVVQGIGFLKTPDDILALPVKTMPNFDVIKIGDIASVEEGKEIRHGAATYNGREAVIGTVMMMTGENSRKVAAAAEARLAEISKDLPGGVKIIPVYSRSDLVNATIGTVWHNIISGSILVIIMLLLLVGNLRAAFITSLAIPLALMITIIGMKMLDISGNLMSLGALDFGIIIDGVVIVVDNCMRKLSSKKGNPDEIVIEATSEIRRSAGFGQLILVVVFLPIFALAGIEAKTFQPMAATFIIALLAAFILSLTLAPALIALLLRRFAGEKESRLMVFLEVEYRRIMDFVLRRSKSIIVAAAVLVSIGVMLFAQMGSEFMPQLKEGALAFHLIRPQNASLSMSVDLQQKAEKIIMEQPGVAHVFSRIGTAEVASDPMGVNVSDTYIMLKNFGKGLDFDAFAESLIAKLKNELPGMTYLASQPIQMRFNELLEGSRADLTIKVFGPDLKELAKIGERIEEAIRPISAESDVELDRTGDFPVFAIEPDMRELQRYGMSKAAVLEQVSLSLSGAEVGQFYDGDKRFPILVRLSDKNRGDLDVIKKLPVPIFGDTSVPLADVADIGFKETYASINRDDGSRRATVMANIRGLDTKSFVEKAQLAVASKIALPDGYRIEWGGQFKNMRSAAGRFAVIIPLTLAIVFFMIYMAFGSALNASLIFMGIPFAMLGGVLGLFVAGLPFSISAAIGFIALSGIAVLNGILLVNGVGSAAGTLKERIASGSVSRLRAVMMTATTDILGFVPMAISTGIGAEVQRPLAVVIIGGITTSTLLTLIVLPAIYYVAHKEKDSI